MDRTTRSGAVFAQWRGPTAISANPGFQLPEALQVAVNRPDYEDDYEPLFNQPLIPPQATPETPVSASSLPPPDPNALAPASPTEPSTLAPLPPSTPATCVDIHPSPESTPQPSEDGFESESHCLPNISRDSQTLPPHSRKRKRKPKKKSPSAAKLPSVMTEAQARRNANKKLKGRMNQRKKRVEDHEAQFSHHATRPAIQEKYVKPAREIAMEMKVRDARVASTAYVGLNDSLNRDSTSYPLEMLVGKYSHFKFDYIAWDGELSISPHSTGYATHSTTSRKPVPIVSQDGYLSGVLAGKPDPQDSARLHQQGMDALEEARLACEVPADADNHRRGGFTALRGGISHGGGQKQPSNHWNNDTNAAILDRLNGLEVFRRHAGFATSVMATWAPDLHCYYTSRLAALHDHDPSLKHIFPSSVFAASTYNLGPQTVCYKHTDFANLPFGWCAVTAFGTYDYKKGGHLILWDCRLVIEFPPGSTILIPSAIVAHSNAPISADERRYSFTQYTAGGLFRWVENGFQKSTVFHASLSEAEKAELAIRTKKRWEFGLSLIPFIKPTFESDLEALESVGHDAA